jgi:hypothetical protein
MGGYPIAFGSFSTFFLFVAPSYLLFDLFFIDFQA